MLFAERDTEVDDGQRDPVTRVGDELEERGTK